MPDVFVPGNVSFNTMIYLRSFPEPRPQTIFAAEHHETLGGAGAGKALNLSKLGMAVTCHSLIGYDYYGERIIETMHEAGLRFLYDIDAEGTQRHINLMDGDGARISIFLESGTFDPDIDLAPLEAAIARSDYLVLNISNYCRRLIPAMKARGTGIWCDIHDYDGRNPYHAGFIEAADYVFMSSDAMPDYRPFMQRLIEQGKRLVVCTHARKGSTALTPDGRWIETPVLSGYPLVDTNGAGDAFFAGFLYGHSRNYPLERCLRLGTIAGGLCVTSRELAIPALSPALIEREYARHYAPA